MNGLIEWVIFLALSGIAIITAAGMIITMSMYRAGLALMASFVALAGLFILLNADLLAAIQVMMNVGGMLVMVLFMVMIMMDPGGERMWGMKRDMHMPGPGAFSMHMPWGKPPEDDQSGSQKQAQDWTCPMHPEVQQDQPGKCPKCGMTLVEQAKTEQAVSEHSMSSPSANHESHQNHENHVSNDKPQHEHAMNMSDHDMHMDGMSGMGDMNDMGGMDHMKDMDGMSGMSMTPRQNYDMMVDMAMSTAQLPWAIVLGVLAALLLIVLMIFTPWPLATIQPTQDATTAVGQLLLSRYMIGFEGAAFLILAGIAGAVLLGKRERPEAREKQTHSTEEETPEMAITSAPDIHVYTCPMHPEVRQSQPGKCPKCGMNLISSDANASEHHHMTQGGHS